MGPRASPPSLAVGTGLTYRPNANAFGSDAFTYTVSDGLGGSGTATVNVTISAIERPVPNAVNDAALSVPESAGATALAVMANDTDPDGDTLTIIAKTNGAHGTVAITGGGTGLTYNPTSCTTGPTPSPTPSATATAAPTPRPSS